MKKRLLAWYGLYQERATTLEQVALMTALFSIAGTILTGAWPVALALVAWVVLWAWWWILTVGRKAGR